MRTLFIIIFSILLVISFFNCSGTRPLSKDNTEAGASARFVMDNGKIVEGIILVVENDTIKYIDTKSHRPEILLMSKIKEITNSQYIFDLEGNKITEADIQAAKSSSKIFTYGAGGTVLGAAVGLGAGLVLVHNYDVPVLYPLATMAIVGGVFFGIQGNKSAYNDAIELVRDARYQNMQLKMRKELDAEKKKLEKARDAEKKKLEKLKEKK